MADNDRAIIIVGAGGIGSALFQDLARFTPHTIDIHLVDGDVVEGKNLQRQMFSNQHRGRNKAQALAETATNALRQDRFYYHPQFLTDPAQLERIARNYKDGVVLAGAVDNHPARRVMEAWVTSPGRTGIYYVDCANEETRGEVVAVYGRGDKIHGLRRSEIDPDVLTNDAGDPTKASCTQQLDAGNVQVLFTNRKAAIIALELISHHLKGDTQTGIVYFREVTTVRVKGVASGGSAEVVSAAGPTEGG